MKSIRTLLVGILLLAPEFAYAEETKPQLDRKLLLTLPEGYGVLAMSDGGEGGGTGSSGSSDTGLYTLAAVLAIVGVVTLVAIFVYMNEQAEDVTENQPL